MTHTLHCRETEENCDQTFVLSATPAKGFKEKDSRGALSEFSRIVSKYPTSKIEELDTSSVQAVFTNKEEVLKAVKELKDTNLGLAITVTGIEQEYSVGISGKFSKLPEDEILEITTMCGHGMISQYLVRQMLLDIKRGLRSPQQAAEYLATPCMCGIFNPKRAQRLLEELVEIWYYDEI